MEKYVAGYSYGKSKIVKVTIKKETPKMYAIESHEKILGRFYYIPTRMHKDKYMFFDTMREAIEYLMVRCRKHKKDLNDSLSTAEEEIEGLNKALDALSLKGL